MSDFKTIDSERVQGKRVLVRVDLNVPMKNGTVTDATRIERAAPTLKELADKGAKVIVLSHFGRPDGKRVPEMSLKPLVEPLAGALGKPVAFDEDCIGPQADAAVKAALETAGFIYHNVLDVDVFIDGPDGRPSGGVHLLFAGEKVRPQDRHSVPAIPDSPPRSLEDYAVIPLDSLVRMKLTSFRDKDRTHLRDLLELDLITREIEQSLPLDLQDRLHELKNNPDG